MDEQYIKNNHGSIMVDDIDIRIAWREHNSCLFNKEFDRYRLCLDLVTPFQDSLSLIGSGKVKEAIFKMKNGNVTGRSRITAVRLKATSDIEVPDGWLKRVGL